MSERVEELCKSIKQIKADNEMEGESRSIHQSLFPTHSADRGMLHGCLLSSLEIKALVADKEKVERYSSVDSNYREKWRAQ